MAVDKWRERQLVRRAMSMSRKSWASRSRWRSISSALVADLRGVDPALVRPLDADLAGEHSVGEDFVERAPAKRRRGRCVPTGRRRVLRDAIGVKRRCRGSWFDQIESVR